MAVPPRRNWGRIEQGAGFFLLIFAILGWGITYAIVSARARRECAKLDPTPPSNIISECESARIWAGHTELWFIPFCVGLLFLIGGRLLSHQSFLGDEIDRLRGMFDDHVAGVRGSEDGRLAGTRAATAESRAEEGAGAGVGFPATSRRTRAGGDRAAGPAVPAAAAGGGALGAGRLPAVGERAVAIPAYTTTRGEPLTSSRGGAASTRGRGAVVPAEAVAGRVSRFAPLPPTGAGPDVEGAAGDLTGVPRLVRVGAPARLVGVSARGEGIVDGGLHPPLERSLSESDLPSLRGIAVGTETADVVGAGPAGAMPPGTRDRIVQTSAETAIPAGAGTLGSEEDARRGERAALGTQTEWQARAGRPPVRAEGVRGGFADETEAGLGLEAGRRILPRGRDETNVQVPPPPPRSPADEERPLLESETQVPASTGGRWMWPAWSWLKFGYGDRPLPRTQGISTVRTKRVQPGLEEAGGRTEEGAGDATVLRSPSEVRQDFGGARAGQRSMEGRTSAAPGIRSGNGL